VDAPEPLAAAGTATFGRAEDGARWEREAAPSVGHGCHAAAATGLDRRNRVPAFERRM